MAMVHVRATDSSGSHNTASTWYRVNVTEPDPDPTPTGLPPLIGSSSHHGAHWDDRKVQLEATGGKLEARRVFFTSISDNKDNILQQCVAEGLVPVISYKLNPYNWAQAATGSADAAMTTAINRVKNVMGTRPVYISFHHEPDKQADPKTVGEGGDGADFGRMHARLADLTRSILPQAKVGPILNGWWFSAQQRGFSDSEINYWMPQWVRDKFDFIAADHYANQGESETSVTRFSRHLDYLDRVGFHGSAGVGETNGWVPSDLTGIFGLAKTHERMRNGFVMLWNSEVANPTATSWKPVHETGLLDDFQEILRTWRA